MRIFLTGATGTFGQAFIAKYIDSHEIVAYSRDELKQAGLPNHPNLKKRLGDVRDFDRTLEAMRYSDMVVHTAAMKRIEACESNPGECIKTNVEGSTNVVRAARQHGIKRLVALSTDKAVKPMNTYGYSKAMMENVVLTAGYGVVRYGNVIGSRGSVIPLWLKQRAEGKPLTVTDLTATRFLIKIEEAVELAFNACAGISIPTMKSASLGDIAAVIGGPTVEIGLSSFEKKHEDITEKMSSNSAERFSIKELKEIVNYGK